MYLKKFFRKNTNLPLILYTFLHFYYPSVHIWNNNFSSSSIFRNRGAHNFWLSDKVLESPSSPNGLINLIHYDDAAQVEMDRVLIHFRSMQLPVAANTSSITALARERELLSYLSPNYSFQAAWASQTATGWSKQLGKDNLGLDMCSLSLFSAVMLDVATKGAAERLTHSTILVNTITFKIQTKLDFYLTRLWAHIYIIPIHLYFQRLSFWPLSLAMLTPKRCFYWVMGSH